MSNIQLEQQSALQRLQARLNAWLERNYLGKGAAVLFVTLVALSALACINLDAAPGRVFLAGELATSDVTASTSIMFQDTRGTESRRAQMKSMQPLVCDLMPDGLNTLRHRVQAFFTAINAAPTPEAREAVRLQFQEQTGEEMPLINFTELTKPATQTMILDDVLPWLDQRFAGGIVMDIRRLLGFKGGVLVRNTRDGQETVYTEPQVIPDLRMVEAELSLMLRTLPKRTLISKRSAQLLIGTLIAPTLIPNYELTETRTAAVLEAMEPSVYHVQRGEIIVRQGERVSHEQQMKLQALGQRKNDMFKPAQFFGVLCLALIIMAGLFFSPSGRRSAPVDQKDLIFIALLVAGVALSAKGLVHLGAKLVETTPNFSPDSLAYAMPVAGLAGLSALLFSTRRYVATGLLISLFGAVMYKASLGLFLFYFFSSMLNTRLVVRTQSRQDVVTSFLPLVAGMAAMWAGSSFLQDGGSEHRYLQEAIAVLAGAVLSMFVVFALAPLMEMLFGYVTRFRLMELLNLDQPVLRELMLTAPGTYHHSLIVSQLVEAGAKAIDAHAMLCKVAALYHDIGKLSRPEYFIENQFGRENPHDKLAPSMSALILLAHVKKGGELAQEYRLGTEVVDIIKQHHGNNVISYFYKRAVDLGENPNEADYSYPGPKPQTREAALVMIADIVEASSRTLDDPTPNRLQQHINNVIKGLFSSGQLDETDVTLKDLSKISRSFHQVLVGLFHQRIKYPDKVTPRPDDKRQGREKITPPTLETDEPSPALPAQ